MLARRVYSNGRQFQTVSMLKAVVLETWTSFAVTDCRKLFDSMSKRYTNSIERSGAKTDYWFYSYQ